MCAHFSQIMNVNEYLRTIKKTKSELAQELSISRPTLNQYIDLYDMGNKIENERYEIIFERLFSDMSLSREKFDKRVQSIKYLLERDRRYEVGNLKPDAADLIARMHNILVNDLSDDQWNRKVYDGIEILLRSYRTNVVMRELLSYFSDLNSNSDLAYLSREDKAFYSFFFGFLRNIVDSEPIFDEKTYSDFLARREQIRIEREKTRNEVSERIQRRMRDLLEEVDSEFKEKGIDVTEEEMVSEVIRRMKR